MNYTGVSCPVCGKELRTGDDIVVCPVCGAPHHRDCYNQLGHCALEEKLHSQGKDWENPNDLRDRQVRGETIEPCPACGFPNQAGSRRCQQCGALLPERHVAGEDGQEPPSYGQELEYGSNQDVLEQVFGTIHESDLIGSIPAKDFIYYTQQNYLYFLRVFKLLCHRTKMKVFNWAACFFSFFYFFYRKMYKIGFAVLALVAVTNIPSFLLSYHLLEQVAADPSLMQTLNFNLNGLERLTTLSSLLSYVRFFVYIFCGFSANRQYYQQSVRQISALRESFGAKTGSDDYLSALAKKGGTSPRSVLLALLAVGAFLFGLSYLFSVLVLQG